MSEGTKKRRKPSTIARDEVERICLADYQREAQECCESCERTAHELTRVVAFQHGFRKAWEYLTRADAQKKGK